MPDRAALEAARQKIMLAADYLDEQQVIVKVALTVEEYSALAAALAPVPGPGPRDPTPETLARLFHETYERLAPSFGYETRKASAVPWEQVPEANRELMIAVCREVTTQVRRAAALVPEPSPAEPRGENRFFTFNPEPEMVERIDEIAEADWRAAAGEAAEKAFMFYIDDPDWRIPYVPSSAIAAACKAYVVTLVTQATPAMTAELMRAFMAEAFPEYKWDGWSHWPMFQQCKRGVLAALARLSPSRAPQEEG